MVTQFPGAKTGGTQSLSADGRLPWSACGEYTHPAAVAYKPVNRDYK